MKYSAFTFCDRITDYVPAASARARFLIPAQLDEFASCLVAEAVGQLAAWVSMAHIGFRGRPVAALAGETRFHSKALPGQTLELEVAIEHCDEEAVSYAGSAAVEGREILALRDCVGPMLPQADYDAPEDLARQFDLLRGAGAQPGRFPGVVRPPLTVLAQDGARRLCRLDVPADATYFHDHFPKRPVFPATLLLDSALRVASDALAAHKDTTRRGWQPLRMTHVKMRDFVLPGQSVDMSAEIQMGTTETVRIGLSAKVAERTVATARVEYGEPESMA